MCGLFSLLTQGWRFTPMASDGKGLSRRSQLLLWLLQHQPEIIEIQLEYSTSDDNNDELLDLSEDEELAEALLKDLLWTENDDEKAARLEFLESSFNLPSAEHETNRESEDGDRAA